MPDRGEGASTPAATAVAQPPAAWKDPLLWTVLLLAALLLFWSLDGRGLWQDEAETALLGVNILHFGLPYAHNGTNVVSQEAGKEFGPDFLWRWSPWIQYYLAAGSMAVLGPTTLAARLPFTLLGFLTVPLTYVLARLFGSIGVARLSALFLTLSVPFLLHTRQARWHGPAYLLVVLLLLGVVGMMEARRFAVAGSVASAVLLFYTNYLVAIGLLAAVAVAAPLCKPERHFLKRLGLAMLLTAILAAPGFIFFDVLGKPGSLNVAGVLAFLKKNAAAFATFVLPAPVLALLAAMLAIKPSGAWRAGDWKRGAVLLLLVCLLYVAYLAFAPLMMVRYLTVLLPPAAILLALSTDWLLRKSRPAGVLVLVLLLATDILHRMPFGYAGAPGTASADTFPSLGRVGFPLYGFLYEITHHFDDTERALGNYLREHARPDDVVLAGYGDLPLQFYSGRHVVGGLEGQPLPARPDWIFIRPFIMGREPGTDADVVQFIGDHSDLRWYRLEALPYRDYGLANNPDPWYHRFKAPKGALAVGVFRKRERPISAAEQRPER